MCVLLGLGTIPLSGATHADGTYDQPVWFEWETAVLDVLIVPPEHGQIVNGNGVLGGTDVNELTPCNNDYTNAIVESVADWQVAINTFGPAWLVNGLDINAHVVGCGPAPPTSALVDPEIVIFSDETKTVILGVAISTRPCLVDNSKFFITSFTYNDMYNINGQEYGHCLGLDHVGGDHPSKDVMDGSYDLNPGAAANTKFCVSNLNIEGLKGVFADTLGQAGGGVTGTVATGSYTKINC